MLLLWVSEHELLCLDVVAIEIAMPAPVSVFPEDFLWGAATSSHQVEGGASNNDWWAWERQDPTRLRDARPSGDAAGWWSLGWAERDLTAAARLGHGAHRLSLEWSRLAPELGKRSTPAIDRYRAILGHARSLGMKTFVTLHHFTLPQWLATGGGWIAEEAPALFAEHARASAHELGDLVDAFLTINEPTVLALKAFMQGRWPPGRRSPNLAARALRLQLEGHAAAYEAVKGLLPSCPVGIAINLPTMEAANPEDPLDHQVTRFQDWIVNGALLTALATGECRPPVGNRPGLVPALRGALDFVGVNYYGRYRLRFAAHRPRAAFGRFVQNNTVRTETADWGEPSPSGMIHSLWRAAELGLPVYVTENGIFDPTDTLRPRYIVEHVRALREALQVGLPLRGYFHWSLVDNFEWAQGWTTPFGLVAMNPKTQARRVRPSAYVLGAIARHNDLPPELLASPLPEGAARQVLGVDDPYD